MRVARTAASICVLVLALVCATGVAVAGPSTTPMVMVSDDFNDGLVPANMTVAQLAPLPGQGNPSPVTWGPITASRAGTSGYGLWCAGTPVTGGPYWPKYPTDTRTIATVDLSQMSDMYSGRLQLDYAMPTLGPADLAYQSFTIIRGYTSGSTDTDYSMPLTSAFRHLTYDLTAPSLFAPMSRHAGYVGLQFWDYPETSGSNGQGPTVDNVVIDGYKYGPVRHLKLTGNDLSWDRPFRSTEGTSAEERTISYRIWRSSDGTSWTELTSGGRLDDATVTYDTGGGAYLYAVQAWDPGAGTGYGLAAYCSARLGLSLTASPNPTQSGTGVQLTYHVTNLSSSALSGVAVKNGSGATLGTISIPAGTTNSSITQNVSPSDDTTYSGSATLASDLATSAVGVRVTVQRVAGADRIATAILTSQRGFPGTAPAVVVATGYRWQEPMVAAALAGQVGGPLLLVKPATLPANVTTEIQRLNPSKIYVVGDSASLNALSAPVYTQLKAQFGAKVQSRIAGSDSYGTAGAVAVAMKGLPGVSDTAFLARGDGDSGFADALAASSIAARMKAPIILTAPTSLSSAASTALGTVAPAHLVVCGGTAAVSTNGDCRR